jgi:hypothetical protein
MLVGEAALEAGWGGRSDIPCGLVDSVAPRPTQEVIPTLALTLPNILLRWRCIRIVANAPTIGLQSEELEMLTLGFTRLHVVPMASGAILEVTMPIISVASDEVAGRRLIQGIVEDSVTPPTTSQLRITLHWMYFVVPV